MTFLLHRLGLCDGDRGGAGGRLLGGGWLSGALYALAHQLGDIVVQGAGVSFLLGDAELRQHFEDGMRGDLELPGQLVDANFAHKRQQRHNNAAFN